MKMKTGLCYAIGRQIARASGAVHIVPSLLHHSPHDHRPAIFMLRQTQTVLSSMGDVHAVVAGKGKMIGVAKGIAAQAGDLATALENKKPVKDIDKKLERLNAQIEKLHDLARKACGYAGDHRP